MITKNQAITAREFHAEPCVRTIGPRGGITTTQEIWRRSGQTKTWKTRPTAFRVPVKHGLWNHSYITPDNADKVHTAEDCPIVQRERSTLLLLLNK